MIRTMTKQGPIGLVVVGVLVGGPAWAQQPATLSERFLDEPPQIAARPAVKPQTARRQPRAADVQVTSQSASQTVVAPAGQPDALDDEALQRKISGICRGC